VGYAGGNDDDVAGMDLLNDAPLPAQLHPRRPAVNAKHFMRRAVVVVIVIDLVSSRSRLTACSCSARSR
jgi:hypothetical protein